MTAKEKGETTTRSHWTFEQEKAFENAVATVPEDCEDRFERIAADVPGKTLEEVKHHYDLLVEDISRIDAGLVPLPNYTSSSSEGSTSQAAAEEGAGGGGGKGSRSDQERRKGIAWTEDEHRLFLLGLDKYGKGDWRSISRNLVVTRTPTQVASHAQKYFIRLNSMNKERRRSSIHDITSVGNGEIATSQGPITAATGGGGGGKPSTSTSKQQQQQPQPPQIPHHVAVPGMGVYGTPTMGQPIGGPLVSAVGTPVNLPQPPQLRAPVQGAMVTGAPIMAYPAMPQHPPAHM